MQAFMRIAQIAPLAESVPPKFYGGTERVVAWLVDELVELGHEVTLFASGDSRTRGRLHPVWPHALRLGRQRTDPNAASALLLEAISKQAKDFDVIHAHIDWLHLPLLRRLGVPFLTTMHGRLDLPGLPGVIREFPEASFVSISDNQRLPLSRRELVWHGPARAAYEPISAIVRPRIIPGVSRSPHGREGTGRSHPHRTRRPNAPTHRRKDTACGNCLLQEAS
jgi:glycosyltransferase involved in cell wall biosynthesis